MRGAGGLDVVGFQRESRRRERLKERRGAGRERAYMPSRRSRTGQELQECCSWERSAKRRLSVTWSDQSTKEETHSRVGRRIVVPIALAVPSRLNARPRFHPSVVQPVKCRYLTFRTPVHFVRISRQRVRMCRGVGWRGGRRPVGLRLLERLSERGRSV